MMNRTRPNQYIKINRDNTLTKHNSDTVNVFEPINSVLSSVKPRSGW